jgi:hypothetical protein
MKIRSSDKSVLMEVARVYPDQRQLVITGKIMGAMPMKAIVSPTELRGLLWDIGLPKLLRIVWLVLFSRKR